MSEVLVCGSTEALKRCSVLSREKLGKILVCLTRYRTVNFRLLLYMFYQKSKTLKMCCVLN